MDFMAFGEAPPHASGRLGHIVLGTIVAAALVLGGATLLARPPSSSSADPTRATRVGAPASVGGQPAGKDTGAGGPRRSWRASPVRDNDPSGG
jgi:hypothetical protein